MRYTRQHKAQTHSRIVKHASRQFRSRGLSGAGVAQVMHACGLTVGGFYKHFHSKDDLLVEAIGESLQDIRQKLLARAKAAPSGEGWREFIKGYLSMEHCDHPEQGCPLAALSGDISRAKPSVKKEVAVLLKRHRDAIMALAPGRNAAEKEKNFIVAITAMSGAISFARTMVDPEARQNILHTVRDHLLSSF
ncbi:MAG TPA: TetR/AcrR family transcriptional regulator [Terriglobales bacterium]|nr:TetR/AcrR family transcriptional regulator [Terriglobales bacterium]